MTFDEAVKVLAAGYEVARPALAYLRPEDFAADDWYTVNPPVVTGTLDMVLDDQVRVDA